MREPLLNSTELTENSQYRRELLDLIASQEAIAFVGAGPSMRVGYPSWNGLVEQLEVLAQECGEFIPPPGMRSQRLAYVDVIRAHIRSREQNENKYFNSLGRIFERHPQTHDRIHKDILRLPFKAYVTTNYDPCFEHAHAEAFPGKIVTPVLIDADNAHMISSFLQRLDDPGEKPVAHLHGHYTQTRSIVLSEVDYDRSYNGNSVSIEGTASVREWTLHRKLLWALLATRRLVFIGFSMSDEYFNRMLEMVAGDLWNWKQSIHYALVPLIPSATEQTKRWAQELWRRYGVRVVFYEDFDATHVGLDRFVIDALQYCGTREEAGAIFATANRMMRAMSYED